LEHEPDRPGRERALVAHPRERSRRAEEHRDVAVVPARVHHPGRLAAVRGRDVRLFVQRQRVHVRSEEDDRIRPVPDDADDPGRGDVHVRDAHRRQLALDDRRRRALVPHRLRRAMELATDADDVRLVRERRLKDVP
jgi:hypothetical protein